MKNLLSKIDSPKDLKKLKKEELGQVCDEVRDLVLNKVSKNGGHTGSNLGIVELTVALHYVFNSPKDKMVFDVSHQTYPHKILTGRKHGFYEGQFNSISGFTSPEESEHDHFVIGHTSSSVSLGLGMAKAREMLKQKHNVISLIGDGSLSGGIAFEGLCNAGVFDKNYIIIVNDNDMCIAENNGGLYTNLAELRETKGKCENNFFKTLGLDYRYLEDGNDVDKLVELFSEVKDIDHPIVLHIQTVKGLGYEFAMNDKENWHWKNAFDVNTGELLKKNVKKEDYVDVIHNVLGKLIDNDEPILTINAAFPSVARLKEFKEKYPDRYYDAGIAEEFTITFACGMAQQNAKPVVFHHSSFIQRTYDQLSHDLALNNLPVVILVFGGTISGGSATHIGDFDISMISNIPNLTYLAPTCKEELEEMLTKSLVINDRPVIIRIPSADLVSRRCDDFEFKKDFWEVLNKGNKTLIVGLGEMLPLAIELKDYILMKDDYTPTVVNPRFISDIDVKTLNELLEDHDKIIVLEAACVSGGYGDKILREVSTKGTKVYSYGSAKEFHNESKDVLKEKYHLTKELIYKDIK